MDHLIDYIREYMAMDESIFLEEWSSGKYDSIRDCPSYYLVKAYCDAIRILAKAAYKPEYVKDFTTTPIKIIRLYEDMKQQGNT